jgi:hypothetical protein
MQLNANVCHNKMLAKRMAKRCSLGALETNIGSERRDVIPNREGSEQRTQRRVSGASHSVYVSHPWKLQM